MLVGRHHQTRQPDQVLAPGFRVVHTGVAGVVIEVLQRFAHGAVVGVDHRFGQHVITAQSAQQRHTFRGAKRQIESVG